MNTKFIKSQILRLCVQPRTFTYLIEHLNGLDPVLIKNILTTLETENLLIKKADFWTILETPKEPRLNLSTAYSQLYLKKYMGYFDFLQTPHPLDFEWRNSTESLNYLTNLIQEYNTVNEKILLLGMPTLFATACIKDIPHHLTLIERNEPIVNGLTKFINDKKRFNIIKGDIFKIAPNLIGSHNCIFMDPPWYTGFFKQFMWLAAKCAEIGAVVGISLPPINTKPDLLNERLEWITFCHEQGLILETLLTQRLHYAMPFFEFNAFRAGGIEITSPFWRKGDLAIFRKVITTNTERPKLEKNEDIWREKEFDGVRIRVKVNKDSINNHNLAIKSLIKTDILPSVSKSHPKRIEANIWSSGNRIYRVNNPNKFWQILQELDEPSLLSTDYKNVSYFINHIIELEKAEYNSYLEWLYYEMERQIN